MHVAHAVAVIAPSCVEEYHRFVRRVFAFANIFVCNCCEFSVSDVRLNIESVFQQFDSQLSAALAKAALETIPGMTTKGALRLYGTFRRNAITALSTWEPVPADMLRDTGRSEEKPDGGEIDLPESESRRG